MDKVTKDDPTSNARSSLGRLLMISCGICILMLILINPLHNHITQDEHTKVITYSFQVVLPQF